MNKLLDESKRQYIGNIVFVMAIILELIVMMTDHYPLWTIPYRGRVTQAAFGLFLIKILCTKYSKKEYIIWVLLAILGTISYLTTREEYVIRCIVMLMAAKTIDVNRVLKLIFVITVAGTAIIIILALMGHGGQIVDVRHYGRGIEEARYCLGFNHANNVHDMLWYIMTIHLLIKKEKATILEYIIITILNIGLFMLTVSRTGFLVIELVVVMCVAIKYIKALNRAWIWDVIAGIEMFVVVFLTIFGSARNIVNSKLVATLDKPLTGRLEMLSENINIANWKMFPAARSVDKVDNGFAYMTYFYGTVIGLVIVIALIYTIFKLSKRESKIYVILFIGAILVMFMEATFIINVSLLCNVLLIIMACDIGKNNSEKC